MNTPEAIVLLVFLLFGPMVLAPIERNLEAFCLGLGIIAVTISGLWEPRLIERAATEPINISIAVIAAGILFGWGRERFDRVFVRARRAFPRPILTAIVIFAIAIAASLITAIVAALVLVEAIGLLRFEPDSRIRVTIVGCFAIGLGAALTPIGEPLATLVAGALELGFFDLFRVLAPYVMPGVAALSILGGYLARGAYGEAYDSTTARAAPLQAALSGIKVFGFIAGLVLISEAYESIAMRYLPLFGNDALYWGNMVSAALDNATLVALEVHDMTLDRARAALLSLLISGGMLIPGNIPNIVAAGLLGIPSVRWARTGVPLGLLMLGICFAVLKLSD
jgi:predicted cation transporter